jgi:hypothetical protein
MSVKKDLEAMTTSAEAIAYYNSYMGQDNPVRRKELVTIIGDAEKELKTLEKSVSPYDERLIIERVGELVVEGV